jgi:hypothetical protein
MVISSQRVFSFLLFVDVLHRLPSTTETELGQLAPHRWANQQAIANSK